MEQIIDMKKYNTSTAKLIKKWSSLDRFGYPYSSTDNRYDVVGLYESAGVYFLYRECAFGEEIAPIGEDEAERLKGFDFCYDPEFDRSAAVDISGEFGYFGNWSESCR